MSCPYATPTDMQLLIILASVSIPGTENTVCNKVYPLKLTTNMKRAYQENKAYSSGKMRCSQLLIHIVTHFTQRNRGKLSMHNPDRLQVKKGSRVESPVQIFMTLLSLLRRHQPFTLWGQSKWHLLLRPLGLSPGRVRRHKCQGAQNFCLCHDINQRSGNKVVSLLCDADNLVVRVLNFCNAHVLQC